MCELSDSAAQTELWEEKVPYMYLDTRGYVTVGTGQMLANVTAAQALPFLNQWGAGPATPQQVADDYFRVKSMQLGMLAENYRIYSSPGLADSEIAKLLISSLGFVEDQLANLFPGYASFPGPAKMGLRDMGYNLGITRLRDEYCGPLHKFGPAVLAQDWQTASAACHRNGPSLARNSWTAEQFSAAYSMKVVA